MDYVLFDTISANPQPDSVGISVVVHLSILSHDMPSVYALLPLFFSFNSFPDYLLPYGL